MDVAVAGSGVAGLSAALLLARDDHRVTLIERDAVSPTDDWRDAWEWSRQGIPHFLQPHAFLPRGRVEMRRHLPDVYQSLLAAGATELDLRPKIVGGPRPEDEELQMLNARRPLIEWALWLAARREPGVTVMERTRVEGILTATRTGHAGSIPHVTGVMTSNGEVRTDLLVDAMGRTSQLPGWLVTAGGERPNETLQECGLLYYSRYFRLREGRTFPDGPWLTTPRGDLGYGGFSTFKGDNGTFAIAFGVPSPDRDLRVAKDERAWTAAMTTFPLMAPLVDPEMAEPITGVLPMGGLQNTLRSYIANERPLATGVVPVADAWCHTDPQFAWGLSMGLIHAAALRDVTRDAGSGEPDAVVLDYFARVRPEAEARFAVALAVDDARNRRWAGESLDFTRRTGCYPLFAFAAAPIAALSDGEIFRRTARRYGFLDLPSAFDDDIELQERVERIVAERFAAGPPPAAGPPRDELLARMREAAGVR